MIQSMQGDKLALTHIERHKSLKGMRAPWDAIWRDLASYVMPRKKTPFDSDANTWGNSPTESDYHDLFDSTAIQANQILANGQLTWMTPPDEPWFVFEPPPHLRELDVVKHWHQEITHLTREYLANSNFYNEIHEAYLNRSCFGTCALYSEENDRGGITFRSYDVGTFSVAQNFEGQIDTVYREFSLTARQAMQMFGKEALPEKIQEKALSNNGKECDTKFKFVHCIFPRSAADRTLGRIDSSNKPIASIYIAEADKQTVRVGGYDEMPYHVSRYMAWGDDAYGWSPAWMALPDTRQLNFLQEHLDALAEIQAFPRILAPSRMEGEVDLRAAGVTYYDENNPNAVPREWGTNGRYDIGVDRVERRQKSINDAFHVGLFQMFRQLDKTMTAREVAERSSEKLNQFSPTFGRINTELLRPALQRAFGVFLRSGGYPAPPQEVLQIENGQPGLPVPGVEFNSRIAMAIKALNNVSILRTFDSLVVPLANAGVENVMDHFRLPKIIRDYARNEAMPPEWIRDEKEVEEIKQQREEALEEQRQAEMARQQSETVRNVGTVPPQNLANLL